MPLHWTGSVSENASHEDLDRMEPRWSLKEGLERQEGEHGEETSPGAKITRRRRVSIQTRCHPGIQAMRRPLATPVEVGRGGQRTRHTCAT
jgi:hypothetical protein